MTGPERDCDVDDWLQTRRSLLRNADDALTLEPPPELDQRVIDRARRELRAAQAEKPRFFRSSRFTMPFAIAATVVLSFSLVLEFNRYESGRDALRARAENTSASTITLTPSVVTSADVAPAQSLSANMAVSSAAASAPAAKAEAGVREAKQEQPARRRQDAFSQSSASAMVAREAAEVRGGAFSDASADRADANLMAAAAPPAPPAAPAAAVAQASAKDAVADAAPRSAAQWWQVVEQLRRAGRKTEAEAELKALRKAYPEFVAPAAQAQPQQ